MKRNYKRLKRYESLLHTVCCIYDYSQLTEPEWQGCLGIACVISVIEGISPNIFSLSKHLEIPKSDDNLQIAFDRLKINGVFSEKQNIKNDPLLNGNAVDEERITGVDLERNAWCNIAGISSGFTGMRNFVKVKKEEVVEVVEEQEQVK